MKGKRVKASLIRSMWTAVMPSVGFAVMYLADIDRLRDFGLPIIGSILLGSALYGVKKYYWPDTEW